MLLGLSLLYVGAVLILNGLWMLGRIGEREIMVINVFTGMLTLLVSLRMALGEGADAASIKAGAFSLLFSLTYLWVACNRLSGADGRGLGWFSLFVSLTAIPISFDMLSTATASAGERWLGASWAVTDSLSLGINYVDTEGPGVEDFTDAGIFFTIGYSM